MWAVFRVAEHATRPKIKQALEDKAVDYLTAKDLTTLDGLEEIVRLGAQIKDINKVNSSVLLREIGGLRSAILELNDCKARMLAPAKNPETAPNIEESFSRPPMRISEIIRSISDSLNKSQPMDGSAPLRQEATDGQANINSGKGERESGPASQEIREVTKEVRQESGPTSQELRGASKEVRQDASIIFEKKEIFYAPAPKQNAIPAPLRQEFEGQATGSDKNSAPLRQETANEQAIKSGKSPAKAPTGNTRFEASISFKDRNDILVKLLSKRTLCHIKDVLQSMPGISERTVRYDVQRLVDRGVIERVGTGGPNSFFRLKK